MKEALGIIVGIGNILTIIGCALAALVTFVSPNPPMSHWPFEAVVATTAGVTLLAVKSVLTLIYITNKQ